MEDYGGIQGERKVKVKKVFCRKTKHGRFMSADCVECKDVGICDTEALENKEPFDDIRVNQV